MNTESHHERELGGKLLASVSRSFYLTLKALPGQLREPVSLAYLLARTADTIADTAQVPPQTRLVCLDEFEQLIHADTTDPAALGRLAALLQTDFQPLQSDKAEAELMHRFADAIAWLRTMDGSRLTEIRNVLRTIIHGQRLDIQRFPADGTLRSLQTADELDEYTYLVAGCVGEFWTRLCLTELSDAYQPGAGSDHVTALGIDFGKGLQLVNILRDIGKDAALGRCYLPQAEWEPLGISLAGIRANPAVLRPVWQQWVHRCEAHLAKAVEYVCAVQHGSLRYATALPLVLGLRTLRSLRSVGDAQLCAGVKISRLEVASVLAQVAMHNSPEGLARLCSKLA